MTSSRYEDQKLGIFEFNKFTYESYYIVDKYKIGNSVVSIYVFVGTIDELKECLGSVHEIVDRINKLDKSARGIFCEKMGADEGDLAKIRLGGIYYYKDEHFELVYDLPEESGLEYVMAIFDKYGMVNDATVGNY